MKALILVGGFGTRLRPLTLTKPKPLVEFCNKGCLKHQIEALVDAGVNEVVLAINYQPQLMSATVDEWAKEMDVKITYSQETEPMGTAGPLKLAADVLNDGDPFFVLNSDVTCEFPLKELLAFHRSHKGEGTVMATKVEEPSKYGVIVYQKEDGLIERFVEKPQEYVGNMINAGIYCFDPAILDRIEMRPTSIEKEIFPVMAADKQLYVMGLEGYWADVGQPKDFLGGMALHLGAIKKNNPKALHSGSGIISNVLVDKTAEIGTGCVIGPDVVIGPNVKIEDGVRISRSTLLEGAHVKSNAWVHDSIIGWSSTVGRWARLDNVTVLGQDVNVKDEIYINGGKVLPHKSIGANIPEPTIIM